MRIFGLWAALAVGAAASPAAQSPPESWSMAGANPRRTSWLSQAPQGIAGVQWYRPIEAYIDQKTQIITANGRMYLSTSNGLIVLNAETGAVAWRFDTEMPLGHSPTVVGDMVYVAGYDRKLYKLRDLGTSYQIVWTFTGAGAGYSVNPLVVNGIVYVGSRDGYFYAVNDANGSLAWQYPAATQDSLGSIMISAAYDAGIVYFAAQDMHAYALNSSSGSLVWKSPQKMPGESYQSWWPVVYDQYVVYSGASGYRWGTDPGTLSFDPTDSNLKELYRDSFFSGTASGGSGQTLTAAAAHNWPVGAQILDTQSNPGMPNTLEGYFAGLPQLRIFPLLNRSNGQEAGTLPYVYTGVTTGNVYPPVVNPNTAALYLNNLRSGTGGGYVISRCAPMGWKPGNRYLHLLAGSGTWAIDEPMAYSGAGTQTYYSLCCDRAAGIVGGTSWWNYGPNPGQLEDVLPETGPQEYDPGFRKFSENLERLNAYYNGDPRRTNGTESRNGYYHNHGLQNPLIPYVFTNSSGQQVNRIFVHRSNTIIALGTTASETFLPLVEVNLSPPHAGSTLSRTQRTTLLEKEIDRIIDVRDANPSNGFLNPGYHNNGGWSGRANFPSFYFQNPGDGLSVLAAAHPHVSPPLRTRLETYLQAYYTRYFGGTPVTNIGWTHQPREAMQFPPEVAASMSSRADSTTGAFAQRNFRALWQYAQVFPPQALTIYNAYRPRLVVPSNLTDQTLVEAPHLFNEWIAGYVGFLNLQTLAGRSVPDAALRTSVQNELSSLMARRSTGFAKDHPWRGDDHPTGIAINQYTRALNVARNFFFVTRELGDYLRQNNLATVTQSFNEYAYLAPFWFCSRVDNAHGEAAKTHLYDTPALFQAKAWAMGASSTELSKYLDVPAFARGDLFYIQNLVATLDLEAAPADSDGDGLPDSWELTHFGNLNQTASGDVDGDGRTNAQEYSSGTNPTLSDTDGDGMGDGGEVQWGLDPLNADQDGNGILDGLDDWDGDGTNNQTEVTNGTSPGTPSGSIPLPPSGLTATAAGPDQIDLAWTDGSTNETQFRIERDDGSGFVQISTTAAGVTSFSDTGLSPSSTYAYRVRAGIGNGASAYSNAASATTLPAPPPPPPPPPAGGGSNGDEGCGLLGIEVLALLVFQRAKTHRHFSPGLHP